MGLRTITITRTLPGSPGWYWYRPTPQSSWLPLQIGARETEGSGLIAYYPIPIYLSNQEQEVTLPSGKTISTDGYDSATIEVEILVEDLPGEWGDVIALPKSAKPAFQETAAKVPSGSPHSSSTRKDRIAYSPPKNQKLNPYQLYKFFFWMTERHQIFLKRYDKQRKPWTQDPHLQSNFFCNVYRELDKTTLWFANNVRGSTLGQPELYHLAWETESISSVIKTIIFRKFNFIPTGEVFLREGLFGNFSAKKAIEALKGQKQIFTSAHVVASGSGQSKLESICETLEQICADTKTLQDISKAPSLHAAHQLLAELPLIGNFVAYEICCDLRFTKVGLEWNTKEWANAGPGAMRGLNRLYSRPISFQRESYDWNTEMKLLLDIIYDSSPWQEHVDESLRSNGLDDLITASLNDLRNLIKRPLNVSPEHTLPLTWITINPGGEVLLPKELPFELREVESSLCEFDKYMRLVEPPDGYEPGTVPKQSKRKFRGI